jgi:hypothetical protein
MCLRISEAVRPTLLGRRRQAQGEPVRQSIVSHALECVTLYVASWLRTGATGQSPMREGRRTRCSSVAASAVRAEATPHPSRHLRTALSLRTPRAKARGRGSRVGIQPRLPSHLPYLHHWGRQGPTLPMGATQPAAGSSSHSARSRRSAPACVLALVPSCSRLQTAQSPPGLPNHQSAPLWVRRTFLVCSDGSADAHSQGLLRRSASASVPFCRREGVRTRGLRWLDRICGGGGRPLPSG